MVEQIQEVPQTTQPVQEVPVELKKKSKLPIIVILLIAVLLIGVGGIYAVKRFNQPKGCTMEARVCPDGSSVGRTGPNCEFAPCPTLAPSATQTPNETANWKTYQNQKYGFEIKHYPELTPNEYEWDGKTESQFIYLLSVYFGTGEGGYNFLKSPYGFSVQVTRDLSFDELKGELIGHTTNKIDSEDEILINNNLWKKINYQVFITTDDVSVTDAVIGHGEYTYQITTCTADIDQILSTFKFD